MTRALCLLISIGCALFIYIEKTNRLNELRLELPKLEKEVRKIESQNEVLSLEIAEFNAPDHLLKLLKSPEYAHLKFPTQEEVVRLYEK